MPTRRIAVLGFDPAGSSSSASHDGATRSTSTVVEVRGGRPVAYPDADINRADEGQSADRLVSVQSVVVDPEDQLWLVDTGSIEFGPTSPGGPKLVGVDLKTNKVFKTIAFPTDVALPTSYLNDVRLDLRRGEAGFAFLTDSAGKGPNGLIVVDLASGKSWRRLHDHPSTKADPKMLALVEGRPVMERPPGGKPKPFGLKERGDDSGPVLEPSLYTKASLHPMWTGLLAVGAGLAVAALVVGTPSNGRRG